MTRPGNDFSGGFGRAQMFFACRLVILLPILFLAFSQGGRAAFVSFTYDTNGNQSSQRTASAAPPVILGSTPSQVVASGEIGGFSVIIASSLTVTYQWYRNGVAIAGATVDSLLLTNITSANDGNYTVTVTNSSGSVTSSIYRLGFDGSGNGLPDSWEQGFFGNLSQSPGGDFDGDIISNLDEYFAGTDPTVREVYYWIAQSGDFNTAANWSRNRVPGAGDTAVINTGTFTLPTYGTIYVSQVTVNVPFTAPTDTNFALSITGKWTFNGPFTLANGRQFAVRGNGGSATVTGATNLNGANLLAGNGAKLFLPRVNSYTLPATLNVNWIAEGGGSELNFANLASINGSVTPGYYLDIIAQYDGKISLPALTGITKPNDGDPHANSGVRLYAYSGSLLSVPQLSSFHDNDSIPNSSLYAEGSTGVIQMPLLLAPVGVQINLNAASHPEQFTSLAGTRSLEFNHGTINMTNLTSLAGFAYVKAGGGAKVTFTNVSSYTLPSGLSADWIGEGTGSELIFPNLASITGSATSGRYLDIRAQYGGKVSLPALTTITKPDDGDVHANSGVRLYAYSGSLLSVPQLSSFHDKDIYPNSSLYAEGNTGVIQMPLLLAPVGVQINLNAASHPEQFTSLAGTRSLEFNNGTINITKLASLAGFTYLKAGGGAKVTFTNVSSYSLPPGLSTDWIGEGSGSELILPNLISITGSVTPGYYLDIRAQYGGKVSLPGLTTITKPNDGDPHANSGVRLYAYSGSLLSAPRLSTFQDNDIHPNSLLYAEGSTGVIQMPLLLAPVGVQINLNAASHPEQFTSLVGTRSLEFNHGTINVTNLTSLAGFTYLKASGGAKVTFMNVSSYTLPSGLSATWIGEGSGSELILLNLISITGSATPGYYLDIRAQYGGKVSLPALTTITKPNDGDPHANSGVRLYVYNGSLLSAPRLSTFHDNDIHPNSLLYAESNGTMILTSLAQPGIRGVTLNGVTLPASAPPPKAINLSTRMLVETGDNVGIGGFIITGTTSKRVILRSIGPSLTGVGVPNALADPVLELHGPSSFVTLTNDNWRDTQENEIQATGIPPADNLESAIVATLAPGAYTAVVRGNGSVSGVALVEIYDLNEVGDAKLANVSTRAAVSTGDNIVIAGFVLGIGGGNGRIVVRGLGQSLTAFGIPNALVDPMLELRDTNGTLLSLNNNWEDDPAHAAELAAAGLAPTNNLESAIIAPLPPGSYTALFSGVNNGTGVGIVEVYDLGGTP